MTWSLQHQSGKQSAQLSFIGGKPRLPAGRNIPTCRLCGAIQTFFFQIAMPEAACWAGSTIAVFHCTKCVDENHLIPHMVDSGRIGANIPDGFLEEYQRNFSFEVFPTSSGKVVDQYKESIRFSEIRLVEGNALGSFGKIGGAPDWLLEDERPATYGKTIPMDFILQVIPDFHYTILAAASPPN